MATTSTLDAEIEKRLDRLVAETGRPRSFYLAELKTSSIEDLEDYYLSLAVLDRVRKGEERVISSKEMWRDMGD